MSDFSEIEAALQAFAAGKMVIVVDDESRENEGDLIMSAQHVTPEVMSFFIKHTGGIICLPMSEAIADQLELPPMVERNTSKFGTAFTVSIGAAAGISTGISAQDRAITVRTAADPKAEPSDLVSPGHIFPLRAKAGGVLERAGHTEAALDLCRLTNQRPIAILSELMHEDGTMMRLPALQEFAKDHDLELISVNDLRAYCLAQVANSPQRVVDLK